MKVSTVYTDSRFPSIELWAVDAVLRIRNGKQGKPEEIPVPSAGDEESYASAFFKGMAYASGK